MYNLLSHLLNNRAPLVLVGWEDPPPTPGEPPYLTALCLATDRHFEPRESLTLRQIAELPPIFCPSCNSMHETSGYVSAARLGLSRSDFGTLLGREVTAVGKAGVANEPN
jgi:hypothetical protein